MLWRIWSEKGTPIKELKYEWTYPDLLKAWALLDMNADYDTAIEGLQETNNGST